MLTVTVADLSPKSLKAGFFSKRGPTRSSKYNLRYWILTESHLYYFTTSTVRFPSIQICHRLLLHAYLLMRCDRAVPIPGSICMPKIWAMLIFKAIRLRFREDADDRWTNAL